MSGPMRVVLGIDAAWTVTQPSGVALVTRHGHGWRVVAAAPSYRQFVALADGSIDYRERPAGSAPAASDLLVAAERIAGAPVDLVAIDMPLSHKPIVGRRNADNAVSRAYGARKCGTHTPSAIRPGKMSDDLRAGFELAGYPLRTDRMAVPGLIEVYPHPALVELMGAAERLPYKAGKVRNYWRQLSPADRRAMLLDQWTTIALTLESRIAGTIEAMPVVHASSSGVAMKACEDVLDAIVCAWVGAEAMDGGAVPYGDGDAAIWVPAASEGPI